MLFTASSDITTAQMQLEKLIQVFILADSEFITLLVYQKEKIIKSFIFYLGKRMINNATKNMNAYKTGFTIK